VLEKGTLAIAIEHRVDKSPGGGIAVFDPTGIQSAFIDAGTNWMPTLVCFGPDHSIWTIGWRGMGPPATRWSIISFFGITRAMDGF
jgi:hypothetical protein